jgi:hypothetical protein
MNVDDRLRHALHDEVDDVEPATGGWPGVETGVRRARRRRRVGAAVATAAALVAAIVAVPALVDRDDARVQTTPAHEGAPTTSTTSAPTTSTSTATTTVVLPSDNDVTTAIWPFTSQAELDAYEANPGVGMFFDPEATALELARSYLGMPDPVRDGDITRTGDGGAVVRIRPKPTSHAVTVVSLQRFDGASGPWSVLGTTTENIELDAPGVGASITSPVHVAGRSIAFEAVVHAEVRGDHQTFGQSLGATTVMGGGTEVAPFSGDITFDRPTTPGGAVVLYTDSAEDGSIVEATIVRVQLTDASR